MVNKISIENLSVKHLKILNLICEELKDEYNILIETIYNDTDKSIDWLVNSLLSRNNYLSTVFTDLCYLELIKRVLNTEDVLLVIVQTSPQMKLLKNYLKDINSVNVKIKCTEGFYHKLKRNLFPIYTFLKNIHTSLQLINAKNTGRLNNIQKNTTLKLVDTFFIESMFNNGVYTDRYYNGLIVNLSDEEKKSLYFVPTIIIKKNIKNIIQICALSKVNFLYKFDLLLFRDYLFALLSPFRIKKIDFTKFEFNDCKVGPILKNDFYRNISNESSFEGILNYLFFKRLKENGIKLSLIVNWFENQVIDRGFNKGVRDFFPQVRCVGYQGFITSFNLNIHFQPSQIEYKSGVIPNQIAVIGAGLKKNVKRFCPQLEVITAPAFRYSNIYIKKFTETQILTTQPTILVTLPLSINEALDILSLLIKVEKSGIFRNNSLKIIPHPAFKISSLSNSIRTFLEKYTVVPVLFSELIAQADLLVSNTSGTCLEALAYGVPVIVVGSSKGVTQNPIPQDIQKTIWEICYTVKEFNQAFERLCIDNDYKKRKEFNRISKEIKRDYFIPVTKKGVSQFLELND